MCSAHRYALTADFNLDGIVNSLDFDVLADNFGKSGRDFPHGDANYDGFANALDFDAIATSYGMTASAAAIPAPVPSNSLRPRRRWRSEATCLPMSRSSPVTMTCF